MALSNDEALQVGNFNPTIVDDIKILGCVATDPANSAAVASQIQPCVTKQMTFLIPDAATATYLYTVPEKMEIIDVVVCKQVNGAANTIQVRNGSGTAITAALVAAVDGDITRPTNLATATRFLNAGAQLQIVATRAAGSMLCTVLITYIPRA